MYKSKYQTLFFISEKKKDPGIPNSLPFKEEILHEAEARKKRVGNNVIFIILGFFKFNFLFLIHLTLPDPKCQMKYCHYLASIIVGKPLHYNLLL